MKCFFALAAVLSIAGRVLAEEPLSEIKDFVTAKPDKFGAVIRAESPVSAGRTGEVTQRVFTEQGGFIFSLRGKKVVGYKNDDEASNLTPRERIYSVEHVKPSSKTGGISILNVTFSRPVDAPTAERMLREETQRAVTAFPAAGLMAYAWLQTNPTPGSESAVSLSDGSGCLVYSPDLRGVFTEKEYSAAKMKPSETGKALQVQLSVGLERGSDSRACVRGSTNLPDGMILMVVLRDSKSDYGTHKVSVTRGGFVSEWLAERVGSLPSGTYEISIISPLPDLQPEEVGAVIGEQGRNLEGSVKSYLGAKIIDLSINSALH